jgi:uncharacterized protein involved in response to NO
LFLAALIGVIGREIIAGKNTRNLKILLAVGLLFAGNVVFHVEAALGGAQAYGTRLGIAAAMLLIMLVGGGWYQALRATGLRAGSPAAYRCHSIASILRSCFVVQAHWQAGLWRMRTLQLQR